MFMCSVVNVFHVFWGFFCLFNLEKRQIKLCLNFPSLSPSLSLSLSLSLSPSHFHCYLVEDVHDETSAIFFTSGLLKLFINSYI